MKKLIALCLTVMLVFAALPVIGVAAANTGKFVVSAPEEAAAGETFDVAINIAENPGIVSAKVLVAYDYKVLEFVSKKDGVFERVTYGPDIANPFVANWVDTIHPNNTTNGALTILTFKVKDGAQLGQSSITLTYDPEDVYDSNFDNVDFTTVDGAVNIVCRHNNTTTIPAKVSTCTVPGNDEYVRCDDCGEILSGSDAPLALAAHTPELRNYVAHTATEDGYTGDKYCSVCDTLIEAGTVIPAGHVTHKVEAVEATCLTDGNIEYWTCKLCDVLFADEEATEAIDAADVVINAPGHQLTDVEANAPTCTENGNIAHKKCEVCGKLFDAEGHELKAEDIIVAAPGHQLTDVAAKDATCTENGNIAHKKCEVCGKMFNAEGTELTLEEVTISATGHDWSNKNGICATCGEKCTHIWTEESEFCVICGKKHYDPGDANGDGKVNNKDLGLLMQKLNGWEVELTGDEADVNGDGKVNNKDYGLLMQFVNNWKVELV